MKKSKELREFYRVSENKIERIGFFAKVFGEAKPYVWYTYEKPTVPVDASLDELLDGEPGDMILMDDNFATIEKAIEEYSYLDGFMVIGLQRPNRGGRRSVLLLKAVQKGIEDTDSGALWSGFKYSVTHQLLLLPCVMLLSV